MASNSFGTHFRITTWGESHGPAIGVVIDGCPPGIEISAEKIQPALDLRAPGRNPFVTPRKESDQIQILSGVYEGKTTGHPISLLLWNQSAESGAYNHLKELYRPGHSNFTYLTKYGIFDSRGGGRSSGRETACRVAAGAVAQLVLDQFGIQPLAALVDAGGVSSIDPKSQIDWSDKDLVSRIDQSPIFCPNQELEDVIKNRIAEAIADGDSIGGTIEGIVFGMPIGLGDPVYEKLEANLAKAMLSIPATKGFEIGEGFDAAKMSGYDHNDRFIHEKIDGNERIGLETNHAGGTLGGISNGMPLRFTVAVKPTSSVRKLQRTIGLDGVEREFGLAEGAKHDPCIAVRAVPVVKAMTQLVLVDALLANQLISSFVTKGYKETNVCGL
jgi:chorismate synthase